MAIKNTNLEKSSQPFSFILKTDYKPLETSYMDENACL